MKLKENLYKQVEDLALEIKADFRAKGVAIPSIQQDGSTRLGNYSIVKDHEGFYNIFNSQQHVIYSGINLPQTALLVANALALNHYVNCKLLDDDKQYGFSLFELKNFQRLCDSLIKQQAWDRYEALMIKKETAYKKAQLTKNNILRSFEKLRRLR